MSYNKLNTVSSMNSGLPVQLLDALFQFTLTEADISVEQLSPYLQILDGKAYQKG